MPTPSRATSGAAKPRTPPCIGDTRPQAGRTPQTTLRPPSRTTSLPFKQAKELINALAFARTILPPKTPWAHVIIVLDQSETDCADPRAYLALQARIFRAMRDFLRDQGLPFHLLWVREIGPRYGDQHTHVLLPLPPELGEELAGVIRRAGKLHDTSNNRAVMVQTNHKHGNTGIVTDASFAGVLRDWCKTMSPRAQLNGTSILTALDTDNRGQVPCTIHGKRSGTSEGISRKARRAAAGWRELETLQQLRRTLPTGAEARRRREQQRRSRRGQQRALGRARGTVPVQPRSFTANDDLAADFFEDE